MSKFVIGIAGQAAAGKDTVCDLLLPHINKISKYNFNKSSFAGNVKKIFASTFKVSMDFIEENKRKSEPPSGFLMPVRKCLQMIGDGFRQIKSDVWIDLVLNDPQTDLIISDVRYCNEAIKIKQKQGLNIIIMRPDMTNNDTNDSERVIGAVANHFNNMGYDGEIVHDENFPMFDYYLKNDGTLEQLNSKVINSLLPFIIDKMIH